MYVILEWSSGKKTQNEEQDADTPEPSSHPLEGFSCSKEELEQEAEQKKDSENSVEPEALDTSARPAEPEVECRGPPVPKTVIDQDSQPSHTPPVVQESQVPCTPDKAVFVEESQEVESYFQEDQTPPEWNEGDGVADDTKKNEPASMPAEPTSDGAEPSQPTTPSKEHLEALEKDEERVDLKSDEEDLARRQAFKAGFIFSLPNGLSRRQLDFYKVGSPIIDIEFIFEELHFLYYALHLLYPIINLYKLYYSSFFCHFPHFCSWPRRTGNRFLSWRTYRS